MKKVHFRIIELPTHQVLLTKAFDNQDDETENVLRITIFFEGIETNISLNYSDEKKRDKFFNEMTKKDGQKYLHNIIDQLN